MLRWTEKQLSGANEERVLLYGCYLLAISEFSFLKTSSKAELPSGCGTLQEA